MIIHIGFQKYLPIGFYLRIHIHMGHLGYSQLPLSTFPPSIFNTAGFGFKFRFVYTHLKFTPPTYLILFAILCKQECSAPPRGKGLNTGIYFFCNWT